VDLHFQKWLLAQEGYGATGSDASLGVNPDAEIEQRAMDDRKKGVGALTNPDSEPLPGNTKGMKKRMKRK
jgi:hypothetical protein